MSCWSILGIQPTSDQRTIKKAYAAKSKLVHPEEHPEEFRELHEAYEHALEFSKHIISADDEQPSEIPKEALNEAPKPVNIPRTKMRGVIPPPPEDDIEEQPVEASFDDELFGIDFEKILEESEQEEIEQVEKLTDLVMSQVEKALTYRSANKKQIALSKALSSDEFYAVVNHSYFAYRLTSFIREHEKLPDTFYLVVYSALRLDILSTREQKGFYTELYEIFVERKKMGFKVFELKREAARRGVPFPVYIFGIIVFAIAQGLRVAKHTVDVSNYFTFGVIMAVLGLFVYTTVSKKRLEKELGKPEDEIKPVDGKLSLIKRVSLIRRVKETDYFKFVTFAGWLIPLNLSFVWLFLEYEGAAVFITFATLFIAVIVLAYMILTNIITFISAKIHHKKPIRELPKEKKQALNRLTLVFVFADIILFVIAIAVI